MKEKQIKITTRWFNYLVIEHDAKIYVRKRTANDIWKNLYEFFLIETNKEASVKTIINKAERQGIPGKADYKVVSFSPPYSQQLSHQKINGKFIKIVVKKALDLKGFRPVSPTQLSRHPFPKLINNYFESGQD